MAIAGNVTTALERASWIRRMFEVAIRLRKERGPDAIADLSLGNPCNEPPAAFFEVLKEEARERRAHRYMTNAGYPEVREAFARSLAARTGLPYETDDICMTVGAAGALNVVLRTLLDPGDEVVLCCPCFVEYPFYVENFHGQCCLVPSRPDFLPDPDRIADACTANTRAVVLNSPNNPTGRLFPEGVYRDLGRALAGRSAQLRRPIYLLFDDPYRFLYYTAEPPPEPARFYDQVLYISSFSKDLGLAGERIGYVAIHPGAADRDDLRRAFPFAMRALGHVNAPALMQRAAAQLIDLPRDDVRAFYRRRRDRVAAALAETGLEYPPLEGAFYAFPRSPEPDDPAFCRRMLDQGLVLVPGTAFAAAGHFRISYAVEEDVLERGLEILKQAV
ncbi:MAG: pyridoxal phosphate-dependent aminotransferase [Planctomycetota bacterium]|jgi:aspartate aminotransferase